MLCPTCRSENPAANGYCGSCGTVLNDASAVVPKYNDRKGLVKREIALVLGVCSALVIAGSVVWYLLYATRTPAHVVRSFIEADRAGLLPREQQYVAGEWDSQAALSFFQTLRRQSGSSPFQNYHILPGGTDKEPAYVNVELTVPPPSIPLLNPATPPPANQTVPVNNVKVVVTFVLKRQNDEWKIDGSQTLMSVASTLAAQGLQQFQANPLTLPNLKLPPGFPNLGLPPGLAPGLAPPALPPGLTPGPAPGLAPAPSGAPPLGVPSNKDGSM